MNLYFNQDLFCLIFSFLIFSNLMWPVILPKWFPSWHWYMLFACCEVTISLQSRGQGCKTVTDKSAMSKEGEGGGGGGARGEGCNRRLLVEIVRHPSLGYASYSVDVHYTTLIIHTRTILFSSKSSPNSFFQCCLNSCRYARGTPDQAIKKIEWF